MSLRDRDLDAAIRAVYGKRPDDLRLVLTNAEVYERLAVGSSYLELFAEGLATDPDAMRSGGLEPDAT